MATQIACAVTLVGSNDPALGTGTPVVWYSEPIDLKAEACLSMQVDLTTIFGANTPTLQVSVEVSNNGVKFTPSPTAIDTGALTVADTYFKSGEICAAHARFKAELNVPAGAVTNIGVATFSISYETETGAPA